MMHVVGKAWWNAEYFSLVFTNHRMFAVQHTNFSERFRTEAAVFANFFVNLATYNQKIEELRNSQQFNFQEMAQTDMCFEYAKMIGPRSIREATGECLVIFTYPTGGFFFKKNKYKFGFQYSEFGHTQQVLVTKLGFTTK